jgi:hypothetical protein
MGQKLNDMRRAIADGRKAEPKPPAEIPKPVKPAPAAAKEAPPADSLPPEAIITHLCKHRSKVRELQTRPCQQCSKANQLAKKQRYRVKAEAKREEARANDPDLGRLPNGSEYRYLYDATTRTWAGALTVPADESNLNVAISLGLSSSGVRKLHVMLDQAYREKLAALPRKNSSSESESKPTDGAEPLPAG